MIQVKPFSRRIDPFTGSLTPNYAIIQRFLSELRAYHVNPDAVDAILEREGDRLVYEVYTTELPEERGHVLFCTTVIHPGAVGNEYHMTKGHFHAIRNRAEVCMSLNGEGRLILQNSTDDVKVIPMLPGTVAHIPPNWAHRLVNVGTEPFSFFSAWEGDATHNYDVVMESGFAKIIVKRDGEPTLITNPSYRDN